MIVLCCFWHSEITRIIALALFGNPLHFQFTYESSFGVTLPEFSNWRHNLKGWVTHVNLTSIMGSACEREE